ncbi:YciI family protein [Pseudoalteromonas xiamenensis]
MFIVNITYQTPLEEIEKHLEAHVAFLDKYYEAGVFLLSGRKNPRTGGVILARADSQDALQAILAEDPFYAHAVARYDVIEFVATKTAEPLVYLKES